MEWEPKWEWGRTRVVDEGRALGKRSRNWEMGMGRRRGGNGIR